jgi:hypothetical protein
MVRHVRASSKGVSFDTHTLSAGPDAYSAVRKVPRLDI